MRLNKYISESGLCSRREADEWIARGRVTINGRRAELGSQVGEGDEVRVDKRVVGARRKRHVYICLNKPVGITCTTERHVAGNIIDFVGHAERIFPIGRLDKDSEGLILLTNDGDAVNGVLRSENNHEKEYIVTVDKPVSDTFLTAMSGGVIILGERTKACKVSRIDKFTFRIILTQGLNRQIRRMCEVFGYEVQRLQRIRIMNIRLSNLRSGHWRNLTEKELNGLLATQGRSNSNPHARRCKHGDDARLAPRHHKPA
jgi:23S rRNA pseudouridine2604 synthase